METTTKYYIFPDPMATPEEKATKKYGLQMGRAILHHYYNNGIRLFYNNRINYKKWLAYSMGKQPVYPYQSRLDCWGEQGEEGGETYMRVNWQILNLASNFVNLIVGKLLKVQYDVEATILDPLALDAKKQKEYLLKAHLELKDWAAEMGVGVDTSRFGIDPAELQTSDEAEIHMNMNYKDRMAEEIEMAIQLHLTRNNFSQIRKEYLQDAVIFGTMAVDCRNNPLGDTKIKRQDPQTVVTATSRSEDHSGSDYNGVYEDYTFTELQQMAQGEFTEEQYKDIYEKHCTYKIPAEANLNPVPIDSYYNRTREKVVRVFKFYFLTSIQDTYEKKKDKLGNSRLYKTQSNRGKSKTWQEKYEGEREIIKDTYQVAYEGYHIVGSDYLFGYQQVADMEVSRNNMSNTQLPLRVFAPNMMDGQTTSIVENCLPVFDEIQINWLQFQHCIGSYIPDGHAIDLDVLVEAPLGKAGKKLTPRQMMDLFYKKGTFAYKGKNLAGNRNGNGSPIEPIQNSNITKAEGFLQNISTLLGVLNRIVGLNDFSNAATPSSEALAGVGQMALQGTEDAMAYLYNADKQIYKKICESLVLLTQNAVKKGKVSGYVNSLGSSSVKFWEVNKDVSLYDFGITITPAPTQGEWQQFYGQLQGAVDKGELSTADFIAIQEVKNLRLARQLMVVRERRNKAQAQAAADRNIALQGQQNQQSATAAEKEKQNTIILEGKIKLETELALKEKDKEIMLLKYQGDYKLKEMDLMVKTQHKVIDADVSMATTALGIKAGQEERAQARKELANQE
jgi:hypothetical protein